MMPVEAAIIEKLRRSGPGCLDDVIAYLPNFSWGAVFVAVDWDVEGRTRVASPSRLLDLLDRTPLAVCEIQFNLKQRRGRDDNESNGSLTREVERASGSLALCASGPDIGRAVPE